MNDWNVEDDNLGKAYDGALMRRLLRYVKPYKGLFALAVGFVLLVTAFDLSLPYLTKIAIDQYIVPPYAELDLSKLDGVSQELPTQGSAIELGSARYLVNTTTLDGGTRRLWEARGALSSERYVVVTLDDPPKLQQLAASQPGVFSRAPGGTYYASSEALTRLSVGQRASLRAADLSAVASLALLFVLLLVLRLVFSFAQIYVLQYTGQRVMYDMRREIFAHLLRLPLRFFDRNPVGRLVTRATNDVSAINEMYTAVLVNLFRDLFLIVGILAIMFSLNWRLTGMILLLAPLLVGIAYAFRRFARQAYREVRRRIAMLNAFLQENISGMRIIHLFAQGENNLKHFDTINEEKYRAEMHQTVVFAIFNPLIHTMSSLAVGLIIWYGGGQVSRSALSLGALVAFISYVRMLFQPINDLSEKFNILQSAMASSERIFLLLEEHQEDRGLQAKIKSVQGRIEFRDVWFAYNEQEWVLKGVSFVVEPGQTLAIVGATGSGKTTIISLLQRLYDVQKGQILLDGVELKKLDLDFLRAQMAVVLQDVFLFSGDILGNIRLQSQHISQQQAEDAARFVQADKFVKQLDGGYRAEVSERGSTLSAGQRQLLAFARAVAFDPKVLVLDEATANIDSQTEQLIQDSLKKLLEGRTSIVIAHRLSTIRDANNILVLSHGELAESGSHEALLEQGGLYAALHGLQFADVAQNGKRLR